MRPQTRPSTGKDLEALTRRVEALERRYIDPAGSQRTFARLYSVSQADIVIAPNDFSTVTFNSFETDDPVSFEEGNSMAIGGKQIHILQNGVYSMRWRLYLNSAPDGHFTVDMNGIDWDEFLYYEQTYHGPSLTGLQVHGSWPGFRSGPDYGSTPPIFFLVARNPSANTTDLDIEMDAWKYATYLEIVRHGDVLTVDDGT